MICAMSATPDLAAPPACDCHFHVFDAKDRVDGARYVPTYSVSLSDWRALAERADVQRGVLVQPSFLGTDNRQLLAAIKLQPHALRGVAVAASHASVAELRGLREAGIRGIRLNLFGAADDVAAMRALPSAWWSALLAAGMHLELHTDVGRVATLLPMVPREMTVVLDHFAKPVRIRACDDTVHAVCERSRTGGETYVTLSGTYRQDAQNASCGSVLAALWHAELGLERLLWGSDWPCTNFETQADYPALHNALANWLPDEDDWHAVLAVNPHRLYWR
jgi:predicted TIM-barrel fold metal-dependent hydrolase